MTQVFPYSPDALHRPAGGMSSQDRSIITTKTVQINIGNKRIFPKEKTVVSHEPVPTRKGASNDDRASSDEKDSSDHHRGVTRQPPEKSHAQFQPVPLEMLKWLTFKQASLRYPAFSEKSLRHYQAQAEAYQRHPKAGLKSNGFIKCLIRPAGQRKILIDAEKFEEWLRSWAVQKEEAK